MLMTISDEVYEYMDIRGKKTVIISTALDTVKEKAREIDRIAKEKTGESFFADIK